MITSKIDDKFKNLTDLLFYSSIKNLDIEVYKSFFINNKIHNKEYILNVFKASSNIFWENSAHLWFYRLEMIYLLDKSLFSEIDKLISKSFSSALRNADHIEYDISYIQHVELCKVKRKYKKSLLKTKDYFLQMINVLNFDILYSVINNYIPILFSSKNELIKLITNRVIISINNLNFLFFLEKKGELPDKSSLMSLSKNFLDQNKKTIISDKYRKSILALILNKDILEYIKSIYCAQYRSNLIAVLQSSDYFEIEGNHLNVIESLLYLDESLADEIANIYIAKLYARYVSHKKANVDKVIRLLRKFKLISPKKVLILLSKLNRSKDIKYIVKEFPELKNLAMFI